MNIYIASNLIEDQKTGMQVANYIIDDNIETLKKTNYDVPHIIKYMGSKKPILDFIIKNIENVHKDGKQVCDLFSGSCSTA